jgi:hypothetical protein
MEIIEGAGTWTAPVGGEANDWVEHLAVPALSVGTYCIPAGGQDTQTPHTEDRGLRGHRRPGPDRHPGTVR